MSYSSIYKSTVDESLRNRIMAAVIKEAWETTSDFGDEVKLTL